MNHSNDDCYYEKKMGLFPRSKTQCVAHSSIFHSFLALLYQLDGFSYEKMSVEIDMNVS